jgi:hypothetical protein
MKKLIKKFWGVGLIIILLSSMLVIATPAAAADPLQWNLKVDEPSAAAWGLAPGTNIVSYDVDSTGMTMYAAVTYGTGGFLLQSLTGGASWNNLSARLPVGGVGGVLEANDIDAIDLVAIAPDDPNTVVVVDTSSNTTDYVGAAISTNGGASFSSMGTIGAINSTAISGVAISPLVTGNIRYIALYGNDSGTPVIYYYNYGAGVGSWQEAVSGASWSGWVLTTEDNIAAFAFSPSFPSDFIAVAISTDATAMTMDLHALSFNSMKWDNTALGATTYPVNIYTGAATTFVKTSIALLPDYDGGDESLRIAFVGAAITEGTTELGGVWRVYDSAAQKIYGTTVAGFAINSVAFDGTNLAVGSYDTDNVYRSADAMASSPTFFGARAYKKIGIDDTTVNDQVIVKFAGATLFGAKQGDGSAVSKSIDYGNVWNDFTLMDSGVDLGYMGNPAVQFLQGPGTVTDIYMTATSGDPWYMTAYDATKTSVYRISMFSVQRVLCIPVIAGAVIRGTDADTDVIYLGAVTGTDLYYSADGGTTRWYKRTAPAAITDVAVESKEIVYIGSGVLVYKSSNSGFTWGLPVNTGLTTGAIYTMLSLSEGKLIISSTTGGVRYTTDGSTTWTSTFGIAGGTNVHVAATGLSEGDYIFAADAATNVVWRCAIGASNPIGEFKTMNGPGLAAGSTSQVNTGLALSNGALYALSANGTNSWMARTLLPTLPGTHTAALWGTTVGPTAANFALAPSALKVSNGAPGSVMLYAVDNTAPFYFTYYFEDTVALTGPTLTMPADGTRIEIISELLGNAGQVTFGWQRLSKSTAYVILVALDPAFTQISNVIAVTSSLDPVTNIVAAGTFQPGVTYYWMVSATTPLSSKGSEVRSFVIAPTAATVPTLGTPTNGTMDASAKPAFSWSPVTGATMYEFQLSEGTAFAITLVSEQTASSGIKPNVDLTPGKTYFWRVRALEPVAGDWSEVGNFTVAEPATPAPPPVTITSVPQPTIVIPAPEPAPTIIVTQPAKEEISPAYIWAIIIIGAVLVIAVIVLIVRTRRSV